ncbi:MAG TPA: hypothetical protein VHY08_29715 [Bacillota bacterium]|nr:hypothetical protein [Bacillota bacterium]
MNYHEQEKYLTPPLTENGVGAANRSRLEAPQKGQRKNTWE